MKTRLATALFTLAAAFAAALPAHAADDARREAMKERWAKMTPEEKAAAKEKAKARWENMSPEEKEAAKKRFAERNPDAAARLAGKQKDAAAATPAK